VVALVAGVASAATGQLTFQNCVADTNTEGCTVPAKAALKTFTQHLRMELAPFGIDTTIVCPGWIKTPLTANIGVPKPNMLDLEVAVRVIVDTIRRRRLYHAFPRTPRLQVRLLRWLPSGISDRLIQMLLRALTKNR